ncbi:DUF742 domain-containing protein [Streptomyces spiramenti]|uniref:DUF742 domain-containing protein n=1 Tax=Streptomyces spiramenti TaxID=2720606 RepID=A0ABX1AGE3_9ACTN|nr:DUF742 domain-containing protein [Streptomyces spiramenti]
MRAAARAPEPVLLDDEAGRLIRPYTVCGGRTRPTSDFDLLTLVRATGRGTHGYLDPDHGRVLLLCRDATPVAEIAAHVRLPATVTKVLLSDLVECGAVTVSAPPDPDVDPDRHLLEAVLHGLRTRL